MVDRIEKNPGARLDVKAFQDAQQRLDTRAVVRSLPPGLTEEDFVSILRLALLTECATNSYAAVFEEGARKADAQWLRRFNTNVWVPDELLHAAPFKVLLMSMGYTEGELDRQVRETQEKSYTHGSGTLPVQLTTFGLMQEYLTDHWYGLIAHLVHPAAPEAALMVARVKKRETLHTVWYRNMTAIQVESNPRLLGPLAETLAKFSMPGNALVPELQGRATAWLPKMGGDFQHMARDMVRLIHESTGDVKRMGRVLVDIAAHKGYHHGPVSARTAKRALDGLGGPGYGLIGEAILERVGLSHVFSKQKKGRAILFHNTLAERVRAPVRSWIARQLEVSFDAMNVQPA